MVIWQIIPKTPDRICDAIHNILSESNAVVVPGLVTTDAHCDIEKSPNRTARTEAQKPTLK
jgi:hypothetical protein